MLQDSEYQRAQEMIVNHHSTHALSDKKAKGQPKKSAHKPGKHPDGFIQDPAQCLIVLEKQETDKTLSFLPF